MFVVFIIFAILAVASILLTERALEKYAYAHGHRKKIVDSVMTAIVALLCLIDSIYACIISIGSISLWLYTAVMIILLVIAVNMGMQVTSIIIGHLLFAFIMALIAFSHNDSYTYQAIKLKEKYGLETTVVMLHTDGTRISDIASWLDLTPNEIIEILENHNAL